VFAELEIASTTGLPWSGSLQSNDVEMGY